MSTRALDVSRLPPVAQGPRVTIWWGVLGLIAIEATALGLMVAAYFYLRQNFATWPPVGMSPPDLGWGTVNVLLLVASVVPMYIADRRARREQRRPVLIWLAVTTVLSLMSFGLRVLELGAMHARSPEHRAGSDVLTTHHAPVGVDRRHKRTRADLNAEPREVTLGERRQPPGKRREDAGSSSSASTPAVPSRWRVLARCTRFPTSGPDSL